MTRCKHCLSKAEPRNGLCPVCGIDPGKIAADLSPVEKKVRFHARAILVLAIFHLFIAVMVLVMIPFFPAPGALVVLSIISIALALGLTRYSLWAYKGATIYYFLIGMVNVISIQHGSIHLGGILLALIALYLVGNGTAKAIFERRLPDMI